ncbi:MAG: nicotinate phosphoribosyltransferase [Desulfobacteraceae bacterium]|jgi:nicotinate phosphoribosyltransferase|nr:MAG: nicotinate phosphoribosyltransferase [Desulfobacteraceae bacterium]
MINFTGTYTDQYQLAMAQVYFLKGRHERTAIFDYFFRKIPFNGGYAIFAGLEDLLDALENLRFDSQDIAFLRKNGMDPDFLDYLAGFRFTGTIYSSHEGDTVFPTRPVLSVEADIIQAQIIETLLLNILNFQTLIATKASRMRMAAGDRVLIDFGLRRAHGPGGYYASRAAVIGGFNATSNVRAGRDYDIAVAGTMAHSYIQSYDDELTAFRDFAASRSDDCVLLVDTYDTLASGVPHAIRVGLEMKQQGRKLKGIRLDSGDLAYLSKKARQMLDDAGLHDAKIAASNQLDEYLIKSLLDQKAPIDVFGVGTSLVTGQPDAALDGVYKLAFAGGRPRIKISESIEKITLPHRKQVFRVHNDTGLLGADVVALADETEISRMHHPFDPLKSLAVGGYGKKSLLQKVMENGRRLNAPLSVQEITGYCQKRLNELPDEYKRFEYPHIYKIGISDRLKAERDRLINEHKGTEEKEKNR